MNCEKCGELSKKNGRIKSNGKQRYFCRVCNVSFLEVYARNAFKQSTNNSIVVLLREGCGTRSIARILSISPNTVTRRILLISSKIKKPPILKGRTYEMDELFTYIRMKNKRVCVAYALDRSTREIVDFRVGSRNFKTLRPVIETLIFSESTEIRTDKLNLYALLIPSEIHRTKKRGTNYIERMNLTLRTHLKRLNRRTIAYSKSLIVLNAVLKIYFWASTPLSPMK